MAFPFKPIIDPQTAPVEGRDNDKIELPVSLASLVCIGRDVCSYTHVGQLAVLEGRGAKAIKWKLPLRALSLPQVCKNLETCGCRRE